MKKTMRFASILLSGVAFFACVGCGDNEPSATVDKNYEWLESSYTDSSQLTSWEGLGQTKKMNLVAWNTLQEGGFKKVKASNDVVYPEIERITGVKIDTNESFDNGGLSADVAFQNLLNTGLPDIAYGQWVDPDEVYDLTELIDEYCPTIKARMPKSVWNAANINGGQSGKVYAIPYGLGDVGLSDVDPQAAQDKCIMFNSTTNYYPYILVREDILLDAYPDAHTTAQLQEIYDEEGAFTQEQLFDVEITSAEQFRTEFLPKIYNAIHANDKYQINSERWVEVMSCGYGTKDTWDFMGLLLPYLIGATGNYLNTMHTYWDAIDQEIKLLMTQDFYKAELAEWIELIEEGKYLDDYGILNTSQVIKSEMNRGYYAIAYGSSTKPDGDIATLDNGEKVNYRRVYLKIEKNEHFEFFNIAEPSVNGVCIFKDSVKESDLPQILRWLDFQCSVLCDKLVAWGPQSAGLFETDAQGVRRFIDEDLVNQMVYSTIVLGEKVQKYNLHNGTADPANRVFTFFYQGGSKEHPKTVYDLSSMAGMLYTAYSPATVLPNIKPIGIAQRPDIWKWTNNELEDVESIWGRRDGIEKVLFQVLRSGNINSKWADLEQTLTVSGWTDKYFSEDFTEAFLNLNIDFLDKFYKG